jgi:hypothetical protein
VRIVDACLSGLVLSCSARTNDRGIDLVLVGPGAVHVLFAGWWNGDWGNDGYAYLEGDLVEDQGSWTLKRTDDLLVYFGVPEDDDMILTVVNNRLAQRISSETWQAYLDKVSLLYLDPIFVPAMAEWLLLATPKPGEDPIAARRALHEANRPIGILPMAGSEGKLIDALVIDDFGHAATAHGCPWLESVASQWMTQNPRPTITEFLAWAGEEIPMGSGVLLKPLETFSAGTLEGIALRYVPTTL